MNYALIGCGRIATNHIKAALNNGLHIVSVCDMDAQRAELLLSQNGLENQKEIARYGDYRQMLAEHPEIQLVGIATKSGSHAQVALDCIGQGKHVIIEKPVALSMKEADEILRRSGENRVKVAACHQNRFNAAVQEARKALESGRFGKLSHGSIHIRWNRGESYYQQANWRGTWKEDGGCLMNQCIHGIDLLNWMMGDEAEEVYGVTRRQYHPYIQGEDVGLAVIKFRNGAIATVEGTVNVFSGNLEEALCIFGEKGTVKIGGASTNHMEVWKFSEESSQDERIKTLRETTANANGSGHTCLYGDMIDAIINDRAPCADGAAGRNALEIVLAIYKSQLTGKPVKLPLTDFSCEDMDGYFA